MARILGDLIVKRIRTGIWELHEPLEYHVGSEMSLEIIQVPSRFQTDFASVPWGVRNLFPKDGPWTLAAVIHDYLYFTHGIDRHYSRRECDQIFLEAMGISRVGFLKRYIMYWAVRVGGWLAWKKHPMRKLPR